MKSPPTVFVSIVCLNILGMMAVVANPRPRSVWAQDPFGEEPAGDPVGSDPAQPGGLQPPGRARLPMGTPRPKRDDRVQVHMKDGSRLVGRLSANEKVRFRSAVGEVVIPLDKIRGVQFQKDATQTVVSFRNGDRLTGEWVLQKIHVKTEWGEASLDISKVSAITDNRGGAAPGAYGGYGPAGAISPAYPSFGAPRSAAPARSAIPGRGYPGGALPPRAVPSFPSGPAPGAGKPPGGAFDAPDLPAPDGPMPRVRRPKKAK